MATSDFISFGILEKDSNKDVMWSWIFPVIAENIRTAIIECVNFDDEHFEISEKKETFGHIGDTWFYATTIPCSLPEVSYICCAILAKNFNPELYFEANSIFLEQYETDVSGEGPQGMFVSLFARGAIPKRLAASAFDARKAELRTSLKQFVSTFGIESILVYVGVLLRRRVAVLCSDVNQLLDTVRTIPQFVYSRRDWNIVRPVVRIREDDLRDLHAPFVAGFVDEAIEQRTDLWDVLVNGTTGSVVVAPHAEEDFALGKVHKELAQAMMAIASDDSKTDQALIADIAARTEDMIHGVRSLGTEDSAGRTIVAPEAIKSRKMPASMQRFLLNLAAAEKILAP